MTLCTRRVLNAAVVAIVVAVVSTNLAPSSTIIAAHVPQGFAAAGGPIADCAATSQSIQTLQAGLPQQEEWIRRTEAQLKEAEAGNFEATKELQTAAINTVKDMGSNLLSNVKVLRARVESMKHLSLADRKEWMKQFGHIEDIGDKFANAPKMFVEGANFGELMRQNRVDLQSAAKFFEETGLNDEAAKLVATAAAGWAGKVAVDIAIAGRDLSLAFMKKRLTGAEAAQARETIANIKNAHDGIVSRIESHQEVIKALCTPKTPTVTQQSPQPIPTGDMAKPEAPASKPKSGPSKTRVISAVAAGTGAAVAGIMVGDYVSKQALEEAGLGGSSGGSGSGSSGGMTFVSGGFSCRYNSGGVVSSCADSTIGVNITMKFPAGSRLKILTNHITSTGLYTTTSGNAPGPVTFQGFSGGGWFDRCGPPVTRLDLINTTVSTSVVVASVSGLSLPVTCR